MNECSSILRAFAGFFRKFFLKSW